MIGFVEPSELFISPANLLRAYVRGICFITIQKPTRLRQYDQHGKLMNLSDILREKGFVAGQAIMRPHDKTRAMVVSVLDNKVRLDVENNDMAGQYDISANALLQGEWKIIKKAPAIVDLVHDDFKGYTALQCKVLNEMCAKGEVARRMLELEQQHEKILEHVTLKISPVKGVVVNKGFKAGKFILTPATQKIVTFKEGLQGQSLGKIRDVSLMVLPMFTAPSKDKEGNYKLFVSPFWLVKRVDKPEHANAEIKPVFESDTVNNSVKIPCLVNTVDLNADDEVKVFQKQKVSRSMEPLTPVTAGAAAAAEPKQKRMKTKGPGVS